MLKKAWFKKVFRARYLIILLVLVLIVPGIVWGVGNYYDFVQVDKNTTSYEIDLSTVSPSDGCVQIVSAGATFDYFVPTKSASEWNAFKANKPSGLSVVGCVYCGNGVQESGEVCDGTSPSDQCARRGYNSNPDADVCDIDCTYELDASPPCVCPAGKTGFTWDDFQLDCENCGSNQYYCPGDESSYSVSSGHYSTGGTNTTRTGQAACGSDQYYCSSGVKYTVAARYYSTGGTSTTRTGQSYCTANYYCIAGKRFYCGDGYTSPAGSDAIGDCIQCVPVRACRVDDECGVDSCGNACGSACLDGEVCVMPREFDSVSPYVCLSQ